MDRTFDTRRKPVYVPGLLTGPRGDTQLELAVDTGAVRTLIRPSLLRLVGYDPSRPDGSLQMASATGVVTVPLVYAQELRFLGQTRVGMAVLAHELPQRIEGGGLLGLDFFRGLVLSLDFARGRIGLRPPRPWWRLWR